MHVDTFQCHLLETIDSRVKPYSFVFVEKACIITYRCYKAKLSHFGSMVYIHFNLTYIMF